MKTIEFNKSRSSMFTTLLVLGGLTAFYFYRRNGGKIAPLLKEGFGIATGKVDLKEAATDVIHKVSEQAGPLAKNLASRVKNREISTSSVDMDSLPST